MSNETPSSVRSSSVLERIAELPTDAGASFALAVAAGIVYEWPSLSPPVVRTLVGLPLLLFAPGYTLLAVLYPAAADRRKDVHWQAPVTDWIDWPARLALSLAASVALVPVVALAASVAGIPPTAVPSVVAVLVAVGSVIAAVRRLQLPANRRLRVPGPRVRGWRAITSDAASTPRLLVTVLLASSVLLATATVGYALVVPSDGESYTGLYLSTENESGELVTGSFPTEFNGSAHELVVGVENHEDTRTTYTVVVQLQRVETDDGTTRVRQRRELQRFQTRLSPGDSWEHPHEVAPTLTGEDLRLAYLLYRGDPPRNATDREPYRRTYLWIDVTAPVSDRPAESVTLEKR